MRKFLLNNRIIELATIIMLLIVITMSSLSLTFAWFTDRGEFDNDPDNEIVFDAVLLEDGNVFEGINGVYEFTPTQIGYFEEPNFSLDTSETTIDVLMRVWVVVSWRDEFGDYTLPWTEGLTFDFDSYDWEYDAQFVGLDSLSAPMGWVYFNGVIEAESETPTPLFLTITLLNDALYGDYLNQTAEITVSVEMIQANETGFNKWAEQYDLPVNWNPLNLVWGKSGRNLEYGSICSKAN